MDVEDCLPGSTLRVEHRPIAFVRVSVFFCDSGRDSLHRSYQRIVVRGEIVQRGDVTTRDDQDMQRRLRVDIPNGDDLVVFMHEASRDLPCDDLAEEAIAHDR